MRFSLRGIAHRADASADGGDRRPRRRRPAGRRHRRHAHQPAVRSARPRHRVDCGPEVVAGFRQVGQVGSGVRRMPERRAGLQTCPQEQRSMNGSIDSNRCAVGAGAVGVRDRGRRRTVDLDSAHAVGRPGPPGHLHQQRRERHPDGAAGRVRRHAGSRTSSRKSWRELIQQRAARAEQTAEIIGGTQENDTGAGPTHWYENYQATNSRAWMISDPPDCKMPGDDRRRQAAGGGRARGAARRRRLLHRPVRRPART